MINKKTKRLLLASLLLVITLLCAPDLLAQSWDIPLHAICTSSNTDTLSYLGVNPAATDGFDPLYDIPEPPPGPGYWVRLYFPHPEWGLPMFPEFNSDIRAPIEEDSTKVWIFHVQVNHSTTVNLTWPDLSQVPEGYILLLITGSKVDTIDMRDSPVYSYSVPGDEIPDTFEISIENPPPPDCDVSPTSLDFDTVCVGEYSDRTFAITNTGGGTLSVTVTEACADYRLVGDNIYSLTAGQSDTFTVRFQPESTGAKSCTVKTGNGICSDVGCTGTGKTIPSAPTGCVASDDLCDKVHLCWQDNSNNEDGFRIYRNGTCIDSAQANIACYDDTAGAPGQTYSYCVRAFNGCGESSQCCDDGKREPVPSPPSSCDASDNLCDYVHFCWQDDSNNEDGFAIYRDGTCLDSVDAGVTCYDDHTGEAGETYSYCVEAYNICGESNQCCDDGKRKSVPADPSNCAASDNLCDSIMFSWQDNSTDEDGFKICLNRATIDSVEANVTTFYCTGCTPGQDYDLCVTAYNECGESDTCCATGTALDKPASPDTVSCSPASYTVTINWSDVVYDTGYIVYRDGIALDTLPRDDTTYLDSSYFYDYSLLGEHCYTVCAFNQCGESEVSLSACDTLYLVKGTVRDEDGEQPLGDALVYVQGQSRQAAASESVVFDFTYTDPSGDYWFKLPRGAYFVYRNPDGDKYPVILPPSSGYSLTGLNFHGYADIENPTDDADVPGRFYLSQNFPNPFNPETRIEFSLARKSVVTIDIFNILGEKIRELVREQLPAGTWTLFWDGRDEGGRDVASGIYLCRIRAGDFMDTKKMVLLK